MVKVCTWHSRSQLSLGAQAISSPPTATYSNPTTMNSYRQSHSVTGADVKLSPSENYVAPTPTKRRRTGCGAPNQATKRRKGKLSKLPDMPLDILYEIFSLLHPQDLLKISWTTKAFRRVLTNISSRTVWMNSFASVEGLPARPDGMNEVEYANFLFNTLCQCCYKPRAPIAWAIYSRICKDCQHIEGTWTVNPWSLMPNSFHAIRPFSKKLDELLPTYTISLRPRSRRRLTWNRSLYLKADVEAFFGRLHADALSDNDIATILEKDAQLVRKRNEFAAAGQAWEALGEAERAIKRERLKSLRYKRVIEKLKEEGWAEELGRHPSIYASLEYMTGVRVAKPLTAKAWEELKPSVLPWMNNVRKGFISRRVGELTRIIESSQLHLGPTSDFSLSKDDICWVPGIREIITGGSNEEFKELKAGLAGRLPRLTDEVKAVRSAALLSLLPYENPPAEELSLATTWFKCEHGSCQALQPKGALGHSCFKRASSDASESDRYYMDSVGPPWSVSQGVSFHKEAAGFARQLILSDGGDPETMTHEKMDGFGFVRDHNDAVIETFDSMVQALVSDGSGETQFWMTLTPDEVSGLISLLGQHEFPN